MDCQEHSLREMLASPYGAGVGRCILEKVAGGESVNIIFVDGSAVTLTDHAEALRMLIEEFGWRVARGPDRLVEDQPALRVFGMCKRVERQFTLKEIVARVIDERPELILEFASAWGRLIRDKLIRVRQPGNPTLYEIVR